MPLNDAQTWLSSLLSHLKDGGVWLVPRSSTTYTLRLGNKTLEREGPGDESTEAVARTLGWKIEIKKKKE